MVYTMELPCLDGKKSFHGKAQILIDQQLKKYILQSYDSFICSVDMETREIRRHYGYPVSHTTHRHIKSFLTSFGLENQKWKDIQALPVTNIHDKAPAYTIRLPQ